MHFNDRKQIAALYTSRISYFENKRVDCFQQKYCILIILGANEKRSTNLLSFTDRDLTVIAH